MSRPSRRAVLAQGAAGLIASSVAPSVKAEPFPASKFVQANGLRMATYEAGHGPAVVLLHGFPELAYSWRYCLPRLAAAGYRVIAPDQRGYGLTDRPAAVEAYDMAHLTGDLVGLLDALGLERAVFVGHDWGGLVAWQMPLFYPDRVAGVVGVNTPFFPRLPFEPISGLRRVFGDDMYVVQMQTLGVVDALMAQNTERFFRTQMRRNVLTAAAYARLPESARHLDFLKAYEQPEPARLPGEALLSSAELDVYVRAFRRTGFTGGINWYRNLTRNWAACRGMPQRVQVPSLMISAQDDVVLPPSLTDGMQAYVPDLEMYTLPACGHWTPHERPADLSGLISGWLMRRFPA